MAPPSQLICRFQVDFDSFGRFGLFGRFRVVFESLSSRSISSEDPDKSPGWLACMVFGQLIWGAFVVSGRFGSEWLGSAGHGGVCVGGC